jgi:hypothetical protein
MRYTVVWTKSAEDELAVSWLSADNRNAIRLASDRIDVLLRSNPMKVGRERADETRMLFVPPLAVVFEVRELDRIVVVLSVWVITESQNGQP